MTKSQTSIGIPRTMLQSATKRAYRAAGRRIKWQEARRRAKAWCTASLAGVPMADTLSELGRAP